MHWEQTSTLITGLLSRSERRLPQGITIGCKLSLPYQVVGKCMERGGGQWTCVVFPFIDSGKEQEIQRQLLIALSKVGALPTMGVFSRWDLKSKSSTYFFSPDCVGLGNIYGASPCEKPRLAEINPLINSADMRAILFPGEEQGL